MGMLVPQDEVHFDEGSYADPSGRVFRWRDGLYRGICKDQADFFRLLFGGQMGGSLAGLDFLVPTEVTDLELPPFGLVLQHEIVPYVSYPFEWSPSMLLDAATNVLDLQVSLAKQGLGLKDAHGWNILFQGSRPIYVDVGSIEEQRDDRAWRATDEFNRMFLNPLLLFHRKQNRVARSLLMTDFGEGIALKDVYGDTPARVARLRQHASRARDNAKRLTPGVVRSVLEARRTLSPIQKGRLLSDLRKRVTELDVSPTPALWTNYYQDSFPDFDSRAQWTTKHRSVHSILARLQPTSVLDMGSNSGWFAELAARMGSDVIAMDPDEGAVDSLYLRTRGANLSLLPLVMDLRRPTPPQGLNYAEFRSAIERFNVDLMLGLGLVHHLVFTHGLRFDVIVRALAAFTSKWLAVEFVPPNDQYVKDWSPERKPWYTLEEFQRTLSEHMVHVATLDSDPSPRVILVYATRTALDMTPPLGHHSQNRRERA